MYNEVVYIPVAQDQMIKYYWDMGVLDFHKTCTITVELARQLELQQHVHAPHHYTLRRSEF